MVIMHRQTVTCFHLPTLVSQSNTFLQCVPLLPRPAAAAVILPLPFPVPFLVQKQSIFQAVTATSCDKLPSSSRGVFPFIESKQSFVWSSPPPSLLPAASLLLCTAKEFSVVAELPLSLHDSFNFELSGNDQKVKLWTAHFWQRCFVLPAGDPSCLEDKDDDDEQERLSLFCPSVLLALLPAHCHVSVARQPDLSWPSLKAELRSCQDLLWCQLIT